jgi:hypothetical protein
MKSVSARQNCKQHQSGVGAAERQGFAAAGLATLYFCQGEENWRWCVNLATYDKVDWGILPCDCLAELIPFHAKRGIHSNYGGVIGRKVHYEQMLQRSSLGLGEFIIEFDNNEVAAANACNDNNTSSLGA